MRKAEIVVGRVREVPSEFELTSINQVMKVNEADGAHDLELVERMTETS